MGVYNFNCFVGGIYRRLRMVCSCVVTSEAFVIQ